MATPPSSTSYVRFADGVEEIQPKEDQLGEETVASMAQVARMMVKKLLRHSYAHAKSHGILRGELHMYPNLPEHLAQGVSEETKTYPVITQLSISPGPSSPTAPRL